MEVTPIVFDLDGTLWDSTEQIAECWSKELSVTIEKIQSLMGKPFSEIASALGVSAKELERLQEIEVLYLETHPGKLYPGVVPTLRTLAKKGYPLYLVSNCQSGYIEVFMSSSNVSDLFCDYLCEGDTKLSKQEMLRLLKQKHNFVNPIYVGDTLPDKEASKQAGYRFIGVSYGFGNLYGLTNFVELLNLM